MGHNTVQRLVCVLAMLAVTSSRKDQTRWSRQISSYTADISDWVPLTGPVEKEPQASQEKKQPIAEPRVLTEPFVALSRSSGISQETFPSRTFYNSPANRQLYLQSVPSAPQNYLTEQGFGQGIRFGLSPPNFPLSQGFVAPQFSFGNIAPGKSNSQAITTNPVKFETVTKTLPVPQIKYFSQSSNVKPDSGIVERFVDGYRAENASDFEYNTKRKPQSLQKIKFENFVKSTGDGTTHNVPKGEKEEVQLLYVPLESLNRGQFNFRSPLTTSQLVNTDLYNQELPKSNPIRQPLTDFQKPIEKPLNNFPNQNYFSHFNSQLAHIDQTPKFSTITTPFPTLTPSTPKAKKLRPHQPPLAIFLTKESVTSNQMKVSDVLLSLKGANTIAVLDSVNPLNAPNVFIGPSTMKPPENYVKFELPYLSNIENSDKKLKQLPFFVAPLSYNTPQGFAKIPFPSPHVGSVVINSQIKESPTIQNTLPSISPKTYQTILPTYQPQKPITQKPSVSFYSTSPPKSNPPSNYQSNYYSFEPQTVSSLRPREHEISTSPPKTVNYFRGNSAPQYNAQHVRFPEDNFKSHEVVKYDIPKDTETSVTKPKRITTTTKTTKPPATYSNQLLETHNPYSINQAFHFSTPLDYHNYFEDIKEPTATPRLPDFRPSPSFDPIKTTSPPKSEEIITGKSINQETAQHYLQNYTPDVHYDDPISRYPDFKPYEYSTKGVVSADVAQNVKSTNEPSNLGPTKYTDHFETIASAPQEKPTEANPTVLQTESPQRYEYNDYETTYNQEEITSTSTTTSTTTTRRTPVRHRGRPRYTTARTDSNESSYRPTRRPLRERRPLPNRPRYEPNKITTEKPTQTSSETSSEVTTRSSRTRTRGRVQYKPSDHEEYYEKVVKSKHSKEDDLAYQRDVLHQNYPVTLTERRSTIDIEAITEPVTKTSPTQTFESTTETYDTENAYTNEKLSYTQQIVKTEKDDIYIPKYNSRTPIPTKITYEDNFPTIVNDEYVNLYKRVRPTDVTSYETTTMENEENYSKDTIETDKIEQDGNTFITETVNTVSEDNTPIYSISNELNTGKQEDVESELDIAVTKNSPQETTQVIEEAEENIVQTTPSYNRVRIRPGVVRQHHPASTERSRLKSERKRPAVTYRPAYDRRRTTMRIEEIEADLKTKQIHARPEFQDYKHPVYKPESKLESTTPLSTQQISTKRGSFRRRRPTYTSTTTSSDISVTRRPYEIRNRFRGRRPTEKPTEKPEQQTETTPSTTKNPLHTRYSHKSRLSERYNKKPDPEEAEDQDTNYSINRPKYVEPQKDQWSPKISSDSFKPYNPNDIVDDDKIATTEGKLFKDLELDIITARNEYEDILVSVTPTSNNRISKTIPDIPPTLEALVEQSKVTKSDSPETMSTFETMLEEVMKSLEEQDENEYTSNVMKHKGGEIGEIPPERIISSGDIYSQQPTTESYEDEITTIETTPADSDIHSEEGDNHGTHRRGFWKRVKVRPVTTESFEVAESQYYTSTVNRLGVPIKNSKLTHEKVKTQEKKFAVTTYKPKYQFIKDIFENDDESLDIVPNIDIPKLGAKDNKTLDDNKPTTVSEMEPTTDKVQVSPGDLDLGTGSPDPTIDDTYFTTPIELTTNKVTTIDRTSDSFSFMDYLFGVTSEDDTSLTEEKDSIPKISESETASQDERSVSTTESSYIPEEITTENAITTTVVDNIQKVNNTEQLSKDLKTEAPVTEVETASVSSFMNPGDVVSTSVSTQVSHETEICFRGKCIKTSKNLNF